MADPNGRIGGGPPPPKGTDLYSGNPSSSEKPQSSIPGQVGYWYAPGAWEGKTSLTTSGGSVSKGRDELVISPTLVPADMDGDGKPDTILLLKKGHSPSEGIEAFVTLVRGERAQKILNQIEVPFHEQVSFLRFISVPPQEIIAWGQPKISNDPNAGNYEDSLVIHFLQGAGESAIVAVLVGALSVLVPEITIPVLMLTGMGMIDFGARTVSGNVSPEEIAHFSGNLFGGLTVGSLSFSGARTFTANTRANLQRSGFEVLPGLRETPLYPETPGPAGLAENIVPFPNLSGEVFGAVGSNSPAPLRLVGLASGNNPAAVSLISPEPSLLIVGAQALKPEISLVFSPRVPELSLLPSLPHPPKFPFIFVPFQGAETPEVRTVSANSNFVEWSQKYEEKDDTSTLIRIQDPETWQSYYIGDFSLEDWARIVEILKKKIELGYLLYLLEQYPQGHALHQALVNRKEELELQLKDELLNLPEGLMGIHASKQGPGPSGVQDSEDASTDLSILEAPTTSISSEQLSTPQENVPGTSAPVSSPPSTPAPAPPDAANADPRMVEYVRNEDFLGSWAQIWGGLQTGNPQVIGHMMTGIMLMEASAIIGWFAQADFAWVPLLVGLLPASLRMIFKPLEKKTYSGIFLLHQTIAGHAYQAQSSDKGSAKSLESDDKILDIHIDTKALIKHLGPVGTDNKAEKFSELLAEQIPLILNQVQKLMEADPEIKAVRLLTYMHPKHLESLETFEVKEGRLKEGGPEVPSEFERYAVEMIQRSISHFNFSQRATKAWVQANPLAFFREAYPTRTYLIFRDDVGLAQERLASFPAPRTSGAFPSSIPPIRFEGIRKRMGLVAGDRPIDEGLRPQVEAEIEKQREFSTSTDKPYPATQGKNQDYSDVAAVLAGSKPAAFVSINENDLGTVEGRLFIELIHEAARRGFVIRESRMNYDGSSFIRFAIAKTKQQADALDFLFLKGDTREQEMGPFRQALKGFLLGYSRNATKDFLAGDDRTVDLSVVDKIFNAEQEIPEKLAEDLLLIDVIESKTLYERTVPEAIVYAAFTGQTREALKFQFSEAHEVIDWVYNHASLSPRVWLADVTNWYEAIVPNSDASPVPPSVPDSTPPVAPSTPSLSVPLAFVDEIIIQPRHRAIFANADPKEAKWIAKQLVILAGESNLSQSMDWLADFVDLLHGKYEGRVEDLLQLAHDRFSRRVDEHSWASSDLTARVAIAEADNPSVQKITLVPRHAAPHPDLRVTLLPDADGKSASYNIEVKTLQSGTENFRKRFRLFLTKAEEQVRTYKSNKKYLAANHKIIFGIFAPSDPVELSKVVSQVRAWKDKWQSEQADRASLDIQIRFIFGEIGQPSKWTLLSFEEVQQPQGKAEDSIPEIFYEVDESGAQTKRHGTLIPLGPEKKIPQTYQNRVYQVVHVDGNHLVIQREGRAITLVGMEPHSFQAGDTVIYALPIGGGSGAGRAEPLTGQMILTDGLHMRPSVELIKILKRYPETRLTLNRNGKPPFIVNPNGLLSLVFLSIPKEEEVTWEIEGRDPHNLLKEIEALNSARWNQGETLKGIVSFKMESEEQVAERIMQKMKKDKLTELSVIFDPINHLIVLGHPEAGHEEMAKSEGLSLLNVVRGTLRIHEGRILANIYQKERPDLRNQVVVALPEFFGEGFLIEENIRDMGVVEMGHEITKITQFSEKQAISTVLAKLREFQEPQLIALYDQATQDLYLAPAWLHHDDMQKVLKLASPISLVFSREKGRLVLFGRDIKLLEHYPKLIEVFPNLFDGVSIKE